MKSACCAKGYHEICMLQKESATCRKKILPRHENFCACQKYQLASIANGVTTKNLKGDNTVSISVFNALSIGSGLAVAVLLYMKRDVIL